VLDAACVLDAAGVLGNGLNLLGVQSFSQYVVKDVVLILAVGSSEEIRRISRRLARS
jgi:ABC-type xylose transport system permease subunit